MVSRTPPPRRALAVPLHRRENPRRPETLESKLARHAWRVRAGQRCEEATWVARGAEPRAGEARGEAKATALGLAGGLAAGAVVLVFYAIGFAFAAAAAGLAEALSLWLSLLIVAGVILVVAAILGLVAMRCARKASPPQPSQAIEEAEWTLKTLRGNG